MKALGLTVAGAGAVAAAVPVFHDLDEAMDLAQSDLKSVTSMQKRPWYVKEVDKPTVAIDLTKRTAFSGMNAANGVISGAQLTADQLQLRNEMWAANGDAAARANKSGFTARDQIAAAAALMRVANTASGTMNMLPTPPQGFRNVPLTLANMGCPKWDATPEENTYMLRTIVRKFGGGLMGIARIDNNDLGPRDRMFNPPNATIIDADDFVMNGGSLGIPRKCKWAVCITDGRLNDDNRHMTGSIQYFAFLQEKYEWIHKVQNFLWGLGFQSYNVGDAGNPATPSNFWGYVSGVGEYNRTHNPNVTPEGNVGNGAIMLITDFPLCETKAIDFGVLRFCKTCGVCAEACPAGAIPTTEQQKETTWDVEAQPWRASSPDHERYLNDSAKCAFWYMTNTTRGVLGTAGHGRPLGACGRCANFCVFSKGNKAIIHEMVKATTSMTSLFNGFFSTMDKQSGYFREPSVKERDNVWTSYIGPISQNV